MARRTKEDAQETRNRILDAAERVFERRGVSRATLSDIGTEAGVTRGAIYWHFADKVQIFDAMMLRVMLPLEEEMEIRCQSECPDTLDPLVQLRAGLQHSFRQIVDNERIRRVFEIALHKVEYVDELDTVRVRRIEACQGHTRQIRDALQAGMDAGRLSTRITADVAAIGLHAMIDGLFQSWMLDRDAFDLVRCGVDLFDVFIDGLRCPSQGLPR